MVPVATFASLKEAEERGAQLADAGIDPWLKGVTLYVREEDLERARAILPERPPPAPPEPKKPFHACPRCGAGDPIRTASGS